MPTPIRSLPLLAAFLIPSAVVADTPAPLPAAGLRADVDVLEQAYNAMHPGLLRYNTQTQVDAGFASLRDHFAEDRSLEDAYLAFSRFAASLQCGHTYANFFNQSRAIRQRLFEHDRRVPFHFRWLDGRMVVAANHSTDASLVPGTEVLAIDGIPASRILADMMKVARADGGNDAKRIAWLEVQGYDRYEAFDVFLPLMFPHIGHRMTLQVRSPADDAPRTLQLDGLDDAQRQRHAIADDTDPSAPAWTVAWPQPDLAVLRMPTWALYDATWDWKTFLHATFDTLAERGTATLVIDLRGNEGGLGVGDEILARLTDRDIVLPRIERLVRYRKAPDALVPYLDTWDTAFLDWGDEAKPHDARFLRLTRYDDASGRDTVRPRAPRYAGRVFVLVGAANSSATFEFARQLQQTKLGTLAGQTTGGNRRGINGGAFFFLRLPNSGIEMDLPLIGQFPATDEPDAGIEPDVAVRVTAADIAAGGDPEMAAVLALLAERAPAPR